MGAKLYETEPEPAQGTDAAEDMKPIAKPVEPKPVEEIVEIQFRGSEEDLRLLEKFARERGLETRLEEEKLTGPATPLGVEED